MTVDLYCCNVSLRNSKSEDQLQLEGQDMEDDDDNISNSVHALHNGDNGATPTATKPSRSSPPQSRKKSPPKNLFKVDSGSLITSQTSAYSQDSNGSPDFSTSSLISCSEHYNGDSVLDNLSPKSPSSPETPEWSLMDSYHKSKPNISTKKSKLSPSKEMSTPIANGSFNDFAEIVERQSEAISSSGNRVVITINNNNGCSNSQTPNSSRNVTSPTSVNGSRHIMSPGGSSTGTITPDVKNNLFGVKASDDDDDEDDFGSGTDGVGDDDDKFDVGLENVVSGAAYTGLGSASPQLSESEESDMESLRSYHPPVKVIDIPSALRLAKRLYNLEGFKKTDVSRHLSRNNEFNQVRFHDSKVVSGKNFRRIHISSKKIS